ncbi:MAG: M23 family metallopeptidase [Chitinophagales bacterium]|nr:M23 family metallopeptidase [Chitinophagales bacterium]MDW8274058.1 M23 family metallopeptidase [Chitinophagales bacterium]
MSIFKKTEKFIFNTQTLSYEKAVVSWGTRLLRIFAFICASIVFSLAISSLAYTFIDSPKEKILKNELNMMKDRYAILNSEVQRLSAVLEELHYRDGNIYRVLFESEPIPLEVWQAGSGGVNRYRYLDKYENGELIKGLSLKVDKLRRQMAIQSKSYDQIAEFIQNREQMLRSLPSIQPVINKDLTRLASGFGMRMDPIYKVPKFHEGMDFTAPVGTEVYVTGDGVVETVEYSYSGYGNQVVVDHGYGYKTRYAHLSKFKVKVGQKVKRGDVIGLVGNTGKSTGPHLHYEVIKGGVPVNPVYYYFNDLKDDMFARMLEISSSQGQTLD